MNDPEMIERHLSAFSRGDIDGLMKDYAADAVILIDDQKIEGYDALRRFFDHVFSALFPGGLPIHIDSHLDVSGVVYLKWHPQSSEVPVRMGTDTIMVRDGKIVVHTVAIF